MATTQTETYYGNKTYEAEFTGWFNYWLAETSEYMGWDINASYVSDQQKERIYKVFQKGFNDDVTLWGDTQEEIIQELEAKLWEKQQDFPAWLRNFRKKYNFAPLGSVTEDLLFEAYFKDDEDKIQDIAKETEKFKQWSIRDGEDVQLCSFEIEEDDKHSTRWMDEHTRSNMKNTIDSWLKTNVKIMTMDDLKYLIDRSNTIMSLLQ
jgi:hypothetical protein